MMAPDPHMARYFVTPHSEMIPLIAEFSDMPPMAVEWPSKLVGSVLGIFPWLLFGFRCLKFETSQHMTFA